MIILSESSTVLNDVNALKAKKIIPKQYQKTKKALSTEYNSDSLDDSLDYSQDDDDGSESSSSNKEHTTNWYKVPIMCEDHEFQKLLCQ